MSGDARSSRRLPPPGAPPPESLPPPAARPPVAPPVAPRGTVWFAPPPTSDPLAPVDLPSDAAPTRPLPPPVAEPVVARGDPAPPPEAGLAAPTDAARSAYAGPGPETVDSAAARAGAGSEGPERIDGVAPPPASSSGSELFGLVRALPRPGWVVLDAARDDRFTGLVRFETAPPVTVHLDRGRIYLAERLTDPALGERLVNAGALDVEQLHRGAIELRGRQHLGRLFERVPELDAGHVVLTAELMTEECTGWVANQLVGAATADPYRYHPSGVHRWRRTRPADDDAAALLDAARPGPDDRADAESGADAAADPDADVVDRLANPDVFDDALTWEVGTWHDPSRPIVDPAGRADVVDTTASGLGPAHYDLDRPGDPPVDTATASDPDLDAIDAVEPLDHFEVIWPSGEVDDQLVDVGQQPDPEVDRAGAAARATPSRRRTDPPSHPAAASSDAAAPAESEPDDQPAKPNLLLLSEVAGDVTVGDADERSTPDAGPPSRPDAASPAPTIRRSEPGAAMMLRPRTSVFDADPAGSPGALRTAPAVVARSDSHDVADGLPAPDPDAADAEAPIDLRRAALDHDESSGRPSRRSSALRRWFDTLTR